MKLFSIAFAAVLAATACSAAAVGGRSPTGMVAQARALQAAGPNDFQVEAQRRSLLVRADPPKGLIQTVGQLVLLIEKGLGIPGLEDEINKVLGGSLYGLLNEVGITKAELGLGLTDGPVPDGLLEKLLNLVKIIDDKLGITALEDTIDNTLLGGTVGKLENFLGLNYLLTALGLE